MIRYRTLLAATLMVAATASPATAQDQDAEIAPIAQYRSAVMEALQAHTGALRTLLGGGITRPDYVLPHAESVQALAARMGELFPEGTGGEGTRALPSIWENSDGFAAAVEGMRTAADGLLAAARAGDQSAVATASREVGAACRTCHGDFRARQGG